MSDRHKEIVASILVVLILAFGLIAYSRDDGRKCRQTEALERIADALEAR